MEYQRRSFLRNTSILAGAVLISKPFGSLAYTSKKINSIVARNSVKVYHTGALTGCLTNKSSKYGGLKEVKRLLDQEEFFGLILDAGDFINPSGDRDDHEKAIEMMNKIGYHIATPGSHELNKGQDYLASLFPLMDFSLVNCNYTFSHPYLKSRIKTYQIISCGNFRIGITGAGQDLKIEGVTFSDPYYNLNIVAQYLKEKEKCDLVICVSQLGAVDKQYNDEGFAAISRNVDFIIGGKQPKVTTGALIRKNADQHEVILCHTGTEGMLLGKTHFGFNQFKQRNDFQHRSLVVGLPFEQNSLQAHHAIQQLSSMNA